MAGTLHYVGVFLLLAATALLLVTTISAPVVGDIGMLKVTLSNSSALRHSSVTFGTFGHCVLDVAPAATDQDYCSRKSIGYKPAQIMQSIDGNTGYDWAAATSSDALTNAMILHPIACAVAFVAMVMAMLPGICGAVLGSLVAVLAFILTVVVMAIDFTLFGIIKNHTNKDGSGSHAVYSIGMWTCMAAMILLFFAVFVVLFGCFHSRRKDRRQQPNTRTDGYGYENEKVGHHRQNRWGRRDHGGHHHNHQHHNSRLSQDGGAVYADGYTNGNTSYGRNGNGSTVHDNTTYGNGNTNYMHGNGNTNYMHGNGNAGYVNGNGSGNTYGHEGARYTRRHY